MRMLASIFDAMYCTDFKLLTLETMFDVYSLCPYHRSISDTQMRSYFEMFNKQVFVLNWKNPFINIHIHAHTQRTQDELFFVQIFVDIN